MCISKSRRGRGGICKTLVGVFSGALMGNITHGWSYDEKYPKLLE